VLILTRRVGESIVVGDDIVLTVFEVRGDAVRVGIEAPRSVQVHRQEVYDELKRLNEQSVSPSDDAVDALRGALEPGPAQPGPDLTLVPEPVADDAPAVEKTSAGRNGVNGSGGDGTRVRSASPKPSRPRPAKPGPPPAR
jgi:carbon storage regulator